MACITFVLEGVHAPHVSRNSHAEYIYVTYATRIINSNAIYWQALYLNGNIIQ